MIRLTQTERLLRPSAPGSLGVVLQRLGDGGAMKDQTGEAGKYSRRPEQADSWSGCPDLNRGPLRPERSALTKLRHSPHRGPGPPEAATA
jgi:hypothetical protein